jgi:Tol biopolymer transport system component
VTRTRGAESDLDWSTRNRLVFARRCDLFKMRPSGDRLRRLTETDACESEPDWAPSGTSLTFVRGADIWTMSSSGENAALLVSGGRSPTWSPDGTLIAYVSTNDLTIHTVTPNGTDDAVVGNPVTYGSLSGLDWEPR